MYKTKLFHPGELYFQKKIGAEEKATELARRLISDRLSSVHSNFFSLLNMLFVASVDETGQPWASVLPGSVGFIETIDEKLIRIKAKPLEGDPLRKNLEVDNHLGFLGLDFETRQRNRLSGQLKCQRDNESLISVNKVFGSCPKYIQARSIRTFAANDGAASTTEIQRVVCFDDTIKQLISSSNTLFIASYYSKSENRDADISHRGGKPGFVRVDNETTLTFDDYAGNNIFMTLGNLYSNPVAGLLFIDFKTGDMLQLACRSEIIETPMEKYSRQIRLRLNYGWLIKSALTIESKFKEYSPFLTNT